MELKGYLRTIKSVGMDDVAAALKSIEASSSFVRIGTLRQALTRRAKRNCEQSLNHVARSISSLSLPRGTCLYPCAWVSAAPGQRPSEASRARKLSKNPSSDPASSSFAKLKSSSEA